MHTTQHSNAYGMCLFVLPATNILEPKHNELQKLDKGGGHILKSG